MRHLSARLYLKLYLDEGETLRRYRCNKKSPSSFVKVKNPDFLSKNKHIRKMRKKGVPQRPENQSKTLWPSAKNLFALSGFCIFLDSPMTRCPVLKKVDGF
jgi:hypothetical protein